MPTHDQIVERFRELEQQANAVRTYEDDGFMRADPEAFHQWAASAQHLIAAVFDMGSAHYANFSAAYKGVGRSPNPTNLHTLRGIFRGVKSDFDGGYVFNVEQAISGEIFGDFVALAKGALAEGHHTVAAVLACASLEDALKRFARASDLNVDGKSMQEVVNALKTKGLVSGAQRLFDARRMDKVNIARCG
jgi:hypothetical protein